MISTIKTAQFIGLTFFLSLFSLTNGLTLGLVSKNSSEPLSLLELKTKVLVEGPYAEIEYIHVYNNPYNKPLETDFYFPRTETSIFYKFQAIFRNQTVVGQIRDKEQAKAMYEWNVERGNTAAYAETNAETPDIMQVKVGNIPALESVEIIFSVIQPLETVINKFWGFTLPSVLTERYAPASVSNSNIPNILNVDLEHSAYKEWKIEIVIKSDQPFSYVSNPSHNIVPVLSDSEDKVYKAVWNVTVVPNKDFVVYFRPDKIEEPSTIIASHPSDPNDKVLLVNFLPQLNKLDVLQAQNTLSEDEEGFLKLKNLALKEDVENAKGEFIFVIDRSGSMGGDRIANLKKALAKFLTVLPKDSFFNIVSFGSDYSFYKSQSIEFNQKNVGEALSWIRTIGADMGGTEILGALQGATSAPQMKGYPRIVMALTDGEVFNPNEVINHVRTHADQVRVCTVGIGNGASEYLVKNIAKAGKCTSQFVLDNEDIGDKAIYMIKAATSRYLEDIQFEIKCFDSNKKKPVFSEESKVGLMLKDEPFKKWVYMKNVPHIDYCEGKLNYYNSLKGKRVNEELRVEGFSKAEVTGVWHKVAYDAKIKDLDILLKSGEGGAHDELKKQIIDLSLKYQILTEYTAFLAVIQESTVDPSEERIKEKISNLDSADYSAEGQDDNTPKSSSFKAKPPVADPNNYPTPRTNSPTSNVYLTPSSYSGYPLSASSLRAITSLSGLIFLCWIGFMLVDIFTSETSKKKK